jgi:hypothetical protein
MECGQLRPGGFLLFFIEFIVEPNFWQSDVAHSCVKTFLYCVLTAALDEQICNFLFHNNIQQTKK